MNRIVHVLNKMGSKKSAKKVKQKSSEKRSEKKEKNKSRKRFTLYACVVLCYVFVGLVALVNAFSVLNLDLPDLTVNMTKYM